MTIERSIGVAVPLDEARRLLVSDIGSAAARAAGAEAGDRLDVIRYEMLSSQLEAWAFERVGRQGTITFEVENMPSAGPAPVTGDDLPDWVPASASRAARAVLTQGGVLVVVTLPLEPGDTPPITEPVTAPPAAKPWKSPSNARGPKAVEERFKDQLKRATTGGGPPEAITPNGIQNRILTDTLRSFVDAPKRLARVDAPVVWRDGSRAANPFPLRCARLRETAGGTAELELSFALLSIRHAELDAIVDGAWLRNAQISQPRTQAETDDLVFDISCEQLAALTESGQRSVALRIYQTGLEPAIVGFYRAVTMHLLSHPGSLAVTPMYFHQRRREPQRARTPNGRPHEAPVVEDSTHYSEGAPWTNS
jgi:hypothetical protein